MARNEHSRRRTRNLNAPNGGSREVSPPRQYQFVDIELSKDEKAEFVTLVAEGHLDVMECHAFFRDLGYKVSYSTDWYGGGSICSVSCADPKEENGFCILTGRGRDDWTALQVAAYKHKHICKNGIWHTASNNDDDDNFIE